MQQCNTYRMICTDIDGTLLNSNRELSEKTKHVLNLVPDNVPFVLASSRMPDAMRYFLNDINRSGEPLICYNGALIVDGDNSVLESVTISADIFRLIAEHRGDKACNVSVYSYNNWYCSAVDYWTKREMNNTRVSPTILSDSEIMNRVEDTGIHKIMCMGDEVVIDDIYNMLTDNKAELNLYRSKPTYLEISSKDIDKAQAIDKLRDLVYSDIYREQIVAFGDNHNDIEMINYAGLGVAVNNATDSIKQAADIITDSNLDDGVANVVERLMLN